MADNLAVLTEKSAWDARIWSFLVELAEYRSAKSVMIFLNMPTEPATTLFLPSMAEAGKKIVIPYCEGNELRLFHLQDVAELERRDAFAPGAFGIIEPTADWRAYASRQVDPQSLDLILTPGVAFDRCGGRLGHGKGYYDRLFKKTRTDAKRIGLAFASQIVESTPMSENDERVDAVVTEDGVFRRSE